MFKCCHIVILCPMWAVVVCALSTSDIIGMCPYLSTQKFIRSMSYDKPVWREASGTDLALQRLRRLSKRRIFMFVYVLLYLIGQSSYFLLCFCAGITSVIKPQSVGHSTRQWGQPCSDSKAVCAWCSNVLCVCFFGCVGRHHTVHSFTSQVVVETSRGNFLRRVVDQVS